MSDRPALRVIQIEDPCPLPIHGNSPTERSRFCSHCQRQVHNLSAMYDDEVDRLLCRSAGRLCVQFEQTPEGVVRTLDYAKAEKPRRGGMIWFWTIAGTIAAVCGWGLTGSVTKVRGGMVCRPPASAVIPTPATMPATNPTDDARAAQSETNPPSADVIVNADVNTGATTRP